MRAREGVVLLLLLCGHVLAAVRLPAQDSTFLLTTDNPRHDVPTFLGNGRFSMATSPRGTDATRSYMAGLYEHAPGDVPRIASLPAWNEVDLFNGNSWLNEADPANTVLRSYRQMVDMYNGSVHTSYEWVDGGKRTSVQVQAFVSRADPHLAAIRLEVVPHYGGQVRVSFPMRAWGKPRRLALAKLERTKPEWGIAELWYPGHMVVSGRGTWDARRGTGSAEESASRGAVTHPSARRVPSGPNAPARTPRPSLWMTSRPVGRTTTVAQAAVVTWPGELPKATVRSTESDTLVAIEVVFEAAPGRPYTFYKYVSVVSSDDAPGALQRANEDVRAAWARGYDALFDEHADAWHALWETDIVVDGDREFQRLIHSMLFYLLCSVREGTSNSIPPMGLSSAGYYGHIFWDADTWMFPPLLLMHPQLARSMVMFRSRTLGAAKRNARANGYHGAMYPWEADDRGEETTPRFAHQNARYEIHITGDVALAQWQYYLVTGDSLWLAQHGYPVIKETADFWVSRVSFNADQDRYELRHVVSVDEGLIGIDNDAYTNAVAKRNLEIAVAASRLLGRAADPRWARTAAKLYIPYDSAGGYHPTYENAPPATLGSVVPLLSYPLALPMTERTKRIDLEHALRRLAEQGSGAMMTVTLYPVVAAELGDRQLLDTIFTKSYQSYRRGPFNVLAETPRNDAVNFVTGAGGFLQQVLYGYTGLRLGAGGLVPRFEPLLPSQIERLVLRKIHVRGKCYDVVVDRRGLRQIPRGCAP